MNYKIMFSMLSDEEVERWESEMEMTIEEFLIMVESNPFYKLLADTVFDMLMRGEL